MLGLLLLLNLKVEGSGDGSGIRVNADHLPVRMEHYELPFRNVVATSHIEGS